MDNAAATTYPLLDAANAEAIYTFVSNGEVTAAQAPKLLAEVTEEIEVAIVDDVFVGSLEDSAPLTFYLLARAGLRRALGREADAADFYRIASLGVITGQPQLVNIGYGSIAEEKLDNGDFSGARFFIDKINDAEMAAALRSSLAAKLDPRTNLRARLSRAMAGGTSTAAAEFWAINKAAQKLEPDEESLRMVLDSALGFLYASADEPARAEVALSSHHYLNAMRRSAMHNSLPADKLGYFYEQAAGCQVDALARLDLLELATDFFAQAHDLPKEIDLLLARVEECFRIGHVEDAHDLLGSYFVKANKSGRLAARARWIAYFSETLRTVAENMAKSTQVLLDFLATNPAAKATEPAEYSAIGTVAELLGDRYTAAHDTANSRRNYGIAFELFASAGDIDALNSLRAKA